MNYKINLHLTSKKILDEYFVLNRTTGFIHTFNGTGAYIWNKIIQNTIFKDLVFEFIKEYDIAFEDAQADLVEFMKCLADKQLISLLDE